MTRSTTITQKRTSTPSPRRTVGARGFTIVELLIVVVVIAILAAITIVAFNGVTNRAKASAAQSAAKQALSKIQAYAVENADQYPSTLAAAGVKNSGDTTYQYGVDNGSTPRGFCLTVTSSSVSYFASSANSSPTAGACAGHSGNGVAATITNLVTNPNAEAGSITGFTAGGGALISSSTEWAATGTRSFRVEGTSTLNQGDLRASSLTLEPGKTYSASARVRIPATLTGDYDRSPGILFWWSSGSGNNPNFGPKSPLTAGTYTVTHTFTVPANATSTILAFGSASSTANQVVYYDSIIVTEGLTVPAFADGSSPGWSWNGAPNASTSTGPAL